MKSGERSPGTPDVEGSAWSPFRHTVYTVLWLATVLSNTGSWMQNAAAGCDSPRRRLPVQHH
jgi:hypothetical protein